MTLSIQDMAVFCKKKGFAFINSEIYGGLAGFWDFGPLGVELKNNIKNELWKAFVQQRGDVVGIDGSIVNSGQVWKASGHVDSFVDITLECGKCGEHYRADQLIEETLNIKTDGISALGIGVIIKKNKLKCKKCGSWLQQLKQFNLMFKTNIGSVATEASTAYLRPETAQLIFTNFKAVMETSRMKLPFGIAQLGKAFRNEISPRDFLFRSREFEMMEIEYFVHPDRISKCPCFSEVKNLKINVLTAEMQKSKKEHSASTIKQLVDEKIFKTEWHAYWVAEVYRWFVDMGIKKENLRLREHLKEELAHYATACFDIEYNFPFGWKEIHGNADRGQFDLKQHMQHSKNDMSVFDEETKTKIVPYVAAEPSQGIERAMLAFLFDAYHDDKKRGNIVLKLAPNLAPVKVGVFPLVNKLDKEAKEIYDELKMEFNVIFDRSGSIGRRYARADEIGIPYCITFDFDSLKKKDVTIRDILTTKQKRVKIKELNEILRRLINGKSGFVDIK